MEINFKSCTLERFLENKSYDLPIKILDLSKFIKYDSNYDLLEILLEHQLKCSAVLKNEYFSGKNDRNYFIEINKSDYLEYKSLSEYKLNLYLAQQEFSINKVFNLDHLNTILETNIISNYWHSFENTNSSFHFDEYHNILYVHSGIKTIYLSCPFSKILKSDVENINHFFGDDLDQIEIINSFNEINDSKSRLIKFLKKVHSNFYKNKNWEKMNLIYKVKLMPKEAIYIPFSWWHFVKTDGKDNLSFNFWWKNKNHIDCKTLKMIKAKKDERRLVKLKLSKLYLKYKRQFKFKGLKCVINKIKNNQKVVNLLKSIVLNKGKKFNIFLMTELEIIQKKNFEEKNVCLNLFWKTLDKLNLRKVLLKRFRKIRFIIRKKLLLI